MAVDVSIRTRYIDEDFYKTPKGSVYVIGGVTGGGTGGGVFIPGNYYTKVDLQGGALDDLYIEEVDGSAGQFLFTDGLGNAQIISGFQVNDKGTYTDISIGKTGDSATRIYLAGQGKIKSGGLGQTLFLEGGNGGANGGHLTLDGGVGSSQDGPINIGTNNALDIDLGSGNTPIYLGGDVSVSKGLYVVSDVSILSSINVAQNGVFGGSMIVVGDVSLGSNLYVTNQYTGDELKSKVDFVSGWTGDGYELTKNSDDEYDLEIDNLRVRGRMDVYELILNKIRATNGSLWVSDAVECIAPNGDDASTNKRSGLYYDPSDGAYFLVEAGLNTLMTNDMIRSQQFDGNNVHQYDWKVTDSSGTYVFVETATYVDRIDDLGGGVFGPNTTMGLVNIDISGTWNTTSAGYDIEDNGTAQYFRTNYFTINGPGNLRVQWKAMLVTAGTVYARVYNGNDVAISGLYGPGSMTSSVPVNYTIPIYSSYTGSDSSCYVKWQTNTYADFDDFQMVVNEDQTLDINLDVTGFTFVRMGNTTDTDRQGALYLTASDADAPYMEVLDGMDSHTIGNTNRKVRLGNLEGVNDAVFGGALSGYGLYTDNGYFKGNVYATDGYFSGTINATDGSIGGWDITSDAIRNKAGTMGLWSRVTAGNDINIWAGSGSAATAPFRVYEDGYLFASNAVIAGTITANDGSIGGWNIASDAIYTGTKKVTDGYATSGITFAANGAIHAENFYINDDGAVAAQNISLETPATTIGGYSQTLKIDGNGISETSQATAYGEVAVNLVGYQGGTTMFRRFSVYDGKGAEMLVCNGLNDEVETQATLAVIAGLRYGTTTASSSNVTCTKSTTYIAFSPTAARTVYFYSSPATGQELRITNRSETYQITLDGNGKNIRDGGSAAATQTLNTSAAAIYIYNGTEWQALTKYG